MNETPKNPSARYIVVDTQATTPNHMRRNSAINPRYWVWDTVTQKAVDETTHKHVATLTARQMNKTT